MCFIILFPSGREASFPPPRFSFEPHRPCRFALSSKEDRSGGNWYHLVLSSFAYHCLNTCVDGYGESDRGATSERSPGVGLTPALSRLCTSRKTGITRVLYGLFLYYFLKVTSGKVKNHFSKITDFKMNGYFLILF